MSGKAEATTIAGNTEQTGDGGRRRRIRDLIAVNFGNTLEWYDWTIYSIFAPYFAVQFFNPGNAASALLATLAVFAVGFITRPLGGFIFGAYADRAGRRKSLTVAMMLTAAGSLVVALAPTYQSVGLLASIILLGARLLQGLAHGGEMGTSVTYLVERAPHGRRALFGSSSWVSVVLGTILATLTGLLLTSSLGESDLGAWGWRIAFGVGGVLGLYALYLRRRLTETDAFEETTREDRTPAPGDVPEVAPDRRGLLHHWRAILVVFGLSAGGSVMFYTWLIFMPTHAQLQLGQSASSALTASLIAQVFFLAAILAAGWLGDRIGRKPMVIAFGVAFIILTIPLNLMIDGSFATLLTALLISLAALALLFGVNGAVWAEVFPTRVRAAGVAGPLSLATAIFGGTAPYINTALAQAGLQNWFLYYLMAVSAITLATGLLMKETRHSRLVR
ncbi:Major facilitator superfamily MFS_1 [Arthrobacter crystallopoietes BAB-32]|uniref:Major facilitator superfamily MFS_1 n=1 Tax=Arthrobacter crystallopoietes BAB-32 TaxID=1246476 RepID=N1V3E7_9MICC|nr:MFS transporter [Arthrobacter crystallopoietes]EMY35845.1 Major facilitator superfamily MFS_1 [Arthrobacter crystallopoietes BAB-32]